jgi:hypothetical protein
MQYTKVDATTLAVEIPEVVKSVTRTYDMRFLLSQRDAITAQRDAYVAARQTELDEVNKLITEAEKLGIVAEVPAGAEKEG